MDTSETYIKMCDTSEIQGARPATPWSEKEFYTYRDGSILVWLPRQDQLQVLLGLSVFNLLCSFRDFIEFGKSPSYAANFTSMEQLWLALTMKERFSKVWDNGWVDKMDGNMIQCAEYLDKADVPQDGRMLWYEGELYGGMGGKG